MLAIIKLGLSLVMMLSLGRIAARRLQVEPRRPIYEEGALWFLFGAGLVSLLAFWASVIDSAVGLRLATIAATLSLLYSIASGVQWVLRGLRGRQPGWLRLARQRLATPKSWLMASLWVILVGHVLAIGWASFAADLGGDGLAIWGLKAKIFYLEGGVPPSYFSDLSRQWSHLNYPLLVPLAEAWIYQFLGEVNEGLVKVLFLAFLLSLLALFYGSIRRLHSSPYSLAFTLLFCVTPALLPLATSGYADLPLSTFIFASSAYLYFWLRDKRFGDLLIAAALSALGVWVKREGLVAWLINWGAVAFWALTTPGQSAYQRARAGISYLLPALLLAPWLFFAFWRALPENDFASLTMVVTRSNLHRLPTLMRLVLEELRSIRSWGVLWGLFLLATLHSAPSSALTRGGKGYLFMGVIAYIGLVTLSFVLSIWQPYVLHVKFSLDRLVFHVTPTALFFIAIQLGGMDAWTSERLANAPSFRPGCLAGLARLRLRKRVGDGAPNQRNHHLL